MTWTMCTYGKHKHPTYVEAAECDREYLRREAEEKASASKKKK